MTKEQSYTRFWEGSKRMWITFLFFSFIMIGFVQAANTAFAQTTVTVNVQDATLSDVLWEIQRQTDFTFIYSTNDVKNVKVRNLRVTNGKIAAVLDECLKNSGLAYVVKDGAIAIRPANEVNAVKAVEQANVISGTVVDETGEPVIGANVLVKGTTNGQITDLNGGFSIKVEHASATLLVSYVGYVRQEVKATSGKILKIVLVPDANMMEEVVVTGYGTFKKSAYAGSAASVKNEKIADVPSVSFQDLLQGNATGVQFTSASGQPGSSASLSIRGMGSFNASNSPLYVIDGVPVTSGSINSISSDGGLDAMSTVNTSDIENITIIKDAAAASLYGSRAANGVILVQTKKGKAGKVSISYDGYIDHDMVANQPEVLSVDEFLAHERDVDFGHRVDWYDKLLNKSNLGQSHYLAVSGGGENLTFRASANYKKKDGLDIASSRKEYGVRMGFTAKTLEGLLEIQGNLSTRVINEEYVDYGVFQQAVKLNPTHPLMDEKDPSKYSTLYGFDTYNPVGWLKDKEDGGDRQFSLADFKVKLNILPTLNTELSLARQSQEYFKRIYVNSNHKESIDNMRSGRGTLQEENYTDYTLEWIGNYFTTIDKHTIKLMAGYSYQEFNHRSFSSENANFPSDAMSYNNLEAGDWNMAAGRLGVSSLKEKEKTIGFPARLIYNYDDTYYLTASVRYEGNSKFGANHKWGWFPAASAAWRMSSLPAIKNIEAINDLKLRFSYGVTGRSGFPKYSALARYEQGGYWLDDNGQWTQAWGPTNNPNPDLHWEKQISYNLGVDFSLLKNKLSGCLCKTR